MTNALKKIFLTYAVIASLLHGSYITCQDVKDSHQSAAHVEDKKETKGEKKEEHKSISRRGSALVNLLWLVGVVTVIKTSCSWLKQLYSACKQPNEQPQKVPNIQKPKDTIQWPPNFKGNHTEWVGILQQKIQQLPEEKTASIHDTAFLFYQSIIAGHQDGVQTLLPILTRERKDPEMLKEIAKYYPNNSGQPISWSTLPTAIIKYYKGQDATALSSAIDGAMSATIQSCEMLCSLIDHKTPVTLHDIEYALYREQKCDVIKLLGENWAKQKRPEQKSKVQKPWATSMMLALALKSKQKDQPSVVQLLLENKADPCEIILTSNYRNIQAPTMPYELALHSDQKIKELLQPYARQALPGITRLGQFRVKKAEVEYQAATQQLVHLQKRLNHGQSMAQS